jgi:hypothetical protein
MYRGLDLIFQQRLPFPLSRIHYKREKGRESRMRIKTRKASVAGLSTPL